VNYQYIKISLDSIGLETTWTDNGKKGVATFEADTSYDLILLDIKMPEMDGFETLKAIRRIDPEVKVIAQTAYAMINEEAMIRRSGFDGYLAKPFKHETLLRTVEDMLARSS